MAKIIIYSSNVIGRAMAGAAIRPWEFARVLSEEHQVVLLAPAVSEVGSQPFEILALSNPKAKRHFHDADLLIAQRLTFPLALLSSYHRLNVIIDAYVPGPLELLEHFKALSPRIREKKNFSEVSNLTLSFKMADGMICASEKQRDLWIGFLMGQKSITPEFYDRDAAFRQFLDVVPFGLPEEKPRKRGKGLRERFGFSSSDRVLLWGGGIWNWFDPLSLIQAMDLIGKERSDVKLVFMGVIPPDPALPKTAMATRAIELAEELGLLNRSVFFNQEWVPYEERQDFLLDADIGVSTHFDHLETRFSFRTRLLDYLWASLPIIATEGDSFAETIERDQLGCIVPYGNVEAIAEAVLQLVNDPVYYAEVQKNVSLIREQFYWERAVAPLSEMVRRLVAAPPAKSRWRDGMNLLYFLFAKIRERGMISCLQQYVLRKPPT